MTKTMMIATANMASSGMLSMARESDIVRRLSIARGCASRSPRAGRVESVSLQAGNDRAGDGFVEHQRKALGIRETEREFVCTQHAWLMSDTAQCFFEIP